VTRPLWADLTPGAISKAVLPVIYAGTSLRLLAVRRESQDPAVRDMGVALAATAAALSTLPAAALDTFEELFGDANYGRFLSQLGTVVAAGAGNGVILRSAYEPSEARPRVRSRRQRMLGTLIVMTVLFSRDHALAGELQLPTGRLYRPLPALYWVVFADFMILAAGETSWLALRTSRLTGDEFVRRGLRCVTVGTLILSGFYGQYAGGVVGRLISSRLPGPLRGVPAQAVIGTSAAVIAVGASLPGAMWRWRTLMQAVQDARACIRLDAMWRALRNTNPGNTLSVGSFRSPDVRLFRRVIEILGGLDQDALKRDPHRRFRTAAEGIRQEEGLSEDQVTALERAALSRYGADFDENVDGKHCEVRTVPLTGTAVSEDFREEARRLALTATYLRYSPLPNLIAQHVWEAAHQDKKRTVPTMPLQSDPPAPGPDCTCLARSSDEMGYLEYVGGRDESEKYLAEERARCPIHGTTPLAELR